MPFPVKRPHSSKQADFLSLYSLSLALSLVPARCAHSDPARSEFYWVPPTSETDDGSSLSSVPEDERFYIITGETIRLRVVSEVFSDVTPKVAPKALLAAANAGGNAGAHAHAGQGQGGNHQGANGQGGAATGGIGQGHTGGNVELHTAGPAPYRIEVSVGARARAGKIS